MSCPCGSGKPRCCELYLAGAPAPTAEALMRSRYTAYARGAIDYILATQRGGDRRSIEKWAKDATFEGLAIVRAGADVVEFIAVGSARGGKFVQHERSRFERDDGRWVYVDGDILDAPKNVPCPCGSGDKLKRCHGAA